ncbi:MoaD/ThiS family protein [Caloramator sp. mosi_1]|uniref:MoaD/ThiS family protein n=1 Tax=Caloramator sp. mosi_1 TaxID=3023090 RepID=UPI0023620BBE|nr:MoaD/ThiS family protein [Caloramator sp. mosi_1]WDC83265.1 MoaD/ThiS family protein [Caloramator sp. mosi_1]
MKIRVKLFATLREGRDKDKVYDLKEGIKAKDVLYMLNISLDDVKILLINGQDADFEKELMDGDVVSIFPPVGGDKEGAGFPTPSFLLYKDYLLKLQLHCLLIRYKLYQSCLELYIKQS